MQVGWHLHHLPLPSDLLVLVNAKAAFVSGLSLGSITTTILPGIVDRQVHCRDGCDGVECEVEGAAFVPVWRL